MKILLLFLITLNLFAKVQPFVTDGCTMFPDGTRREPKLWYNCCLAHDLVYWLGGGKQLQKQADQELRACVIDVSSGFRGNLMYFGVRLGHYSPIKNKYQWGWGREGKNPFSPVTNEEKKEALRLISPEPIESEVKENFIKNYLLKYNDD